MAPTTAMTFHVPPDQKLRSAEAEKSSKPDLSAWLTKADAATAIGVSTKTIEQLAKAGQLERGRRRSPETGQTLVVYHPGDVAKLAQERHGGPATGFLVPDRPDAPTNGNGHGLMSTKTVLERTDPEPFEPLATMLLTVWSEVQKKAQKAAKAEKPVLTLDEAVEASGWSRTYLLRRIHDQTLPATKDRGWKIRRRDLEAL